MSHASSSHERGASPPTKLAEAPTQERDLAAALHEVSNALTVVLGWLEEARDASSGNARAARAIDVALSRALIGRDLARRAIGGETPSSGGEVSLATLVHDAARGVEREALRRAVTLSTQLGEGAERIEVRDADAALQILTNLLLNSIAMGSRAVALHARTIAGEARIAVLDDGPGIDPERRETIFDGAPSSRPGGAGLGLHHAHALARDKGGALSLVPSSKGACFELAWPLAPVRSGATAPVSSRTRASLEGFRIAVLDDDDVVLDLLTTALEARGVIVHALRTAAELHALAESERIDGALLDLSPVSSELVPLLRHLEERSSGSKIVLISGSAEGPPAEAEGRISAWVRKPFELSEVLTVLGELMRNPKSAS